MQGQMAWHEGAIAAAEADVSSRAAFITRTYTHLFGAIAAFTLLEIGLYQSGVMAAVSERLLAGGAMGWLLVLGGFMVVGWLASRTAHRARSAGAQYAALSGYVVAEALLFCPLLYLAQALAPGAIGIAAILTLIGFAVLTWIAFATRKDFSFLRGVLMWGGFGALALIAGGAIFGFGLGLFFSVAMVVFAGAAILYDTSNVLHHYPVDRHVAASLALFASVALMFWYVLRIVIALRD